MTTPCEVLEYKIGDRFEAIESPSFSKGSIVELFRDDGTDCPLFKLILGDCRFDCCDGEAGAYAKLDRLKKIEETTQEEPVTLRSKLTTDTPVLITEGASLEEYSQIYKILSEAGFNEYEQEDYGEYCGCGNISGDEEGGIYHYWTVPDCTKYTPKEFLEKYGDINQDTPSDILLTEGTFIDFQNVTEVTQEMVDEVCDIIEYQGFKLYEGRVGMFIYLTGSYDGILIDCQSDALTMRSTSSSIKTIVHVEDLLGSHKESSKDPEETPTEKLPFNIDLNIDSNILEVIKVLSKAAQRTGSKEITTLVEELSKKVAEKLLG